MIKRALGMLCVFLVAAAAIFAAMKLLFVGNSHTYYNNMPAIVLRLLEATGQKSHVTMVTSGGKDLIYHSKRPDVFFNITYGGYDAVIVQDKASGFERAAFLEGAATLKDMTDKAGVPIYFYMPWALRDNRSAQQEMTNAYDAFCRSNRCPLAPAGEVFSRILLHESPELLYNEDGNHATPIGSYLAAVTVFYAVTGRKRVLHPENIDDPGIAAGIPVELCRRIHAEACRATRLYNG